VIYFIQDSESRAIKIGVSKHPIIRLRQLQTAHHSKLVLLKTMDGDAKGEWTLHQIFTRRKGEWFEPTEELLSFIASDSPIPSLHKAPRPNQNLTAKESAILRSIAAHYGFLQTRGRSAGVEGSAFALQLAIVHGDAQVVSFDRDRLRLLIAWLGQEAGHDAAPSKTIRKLAAQLAHTLPAPVEVPPPTGEPGPINTLEG
jgi:hypothetical protein